MDVFWTMFAYGLIAALIAGLTAATTWLVGTRMGDGKLKIALLRVRSPEAAVASVIGIYAVIGTLLYLLI